VLKHHLIASVFTFQAFRGTSLMYLGEQAAEFDEKGEAEKEKRSSRCHATFYERTVSLKALGSVASFLRNRNFTGSSATLVN